MKNRIIVSLKDVILFVVIIFGIYFFVFYKKNSVMPERNNFIGMTRQNVLEWIDREGRMTKYSFIAPDNELWNKIEIRNEVSTFIYNDIGEVKADDDIMKEKKWLVGGLSLSDGSRWFYALTFKNDIVVRQEDYGIFH